jgi:hypothetical protein
MYPVIGEFSSDIKSSLQISILAMDWQSLTTSQFWPNAQGLGPKITAEPLNAPAMVDASTHYPK